MIVRYDGRGSGLSDRSVSDHSLDAHMLDLEAVVERLALERFALLANFVGGQVAIGYAARFPERLSHLILLNNYARRSDYEKVPQLRAVRSVLESDWETYTETVAHMIIGWSAGEQAHRFAAYVRECVTPEVLKEILDARVTADVTDLLPQVAAPTLVMQHSQVPLPGLDITRSLASGIPNAQLILLEGTFLSDPEAQVRAILEFLGASVEEETLAEPDVTLPEGMTAILFLDIADSTALTSKLGDAAYREQERELDASLRSAIIDAGGSPVEGKVLGDGIMSVFTSARQAIDAAKRCRDLGNQAGLPLCLGIHAGDVVREGNNVHGGDTGRLAGRGPRRAG